MKAARVEGMVLENRRNTREIAYYCLPSKWKWLFVNVCEKKIPIPEATESLNSMPSWEKLIDNMWDYVEK
jgi:hypothetical protein